jgi:hypothetical protein
MRPRGSARTTAPPLARSFFAGAEVAERLSDDNAANLFKRVISYERLGDLELAEKRLESAADWYVKGFDAARRRVALKSNGGGAEPVCVSPPIDQQELGGSA